MRRPFGAGLERGGVLERDLAQPLRLERLLGQRHASVEHLRVAADAPALEIEPADAVEADAGTLGLRPGRLETEAIAGIADAAADRRIEELPAEVAPALGEVRQHLLDGLPARRGSEEVIVVDAIRSEQIR